MSDNNHVNVGSKNRVVFGPLEPGYGATVGNSIRRVLLSSVPGLGLVGFKIKGVNNIFSSIDGVKEDVRYIAINLKKIIFQSHLNEFIMSLHAKGGEVTAGMFSIVDRREKIAFDALVSEMEIDGSDSDSDNEGGIQDNGRHSAVQILNPDQHICQLSSGAEIEIEIFVKLGRGYVSTDFLDAPEDFIKVDAAFSPIRRVAYRVENVRVGQRTDYDQLVLEVETDGSIESSDAVNKACMILRDVFADLMNQSNHFEQCSIETEEVIDERWTHEIVSALNLSNRAQSLMSALNLVYIGDLVTASEKQLFSIPGYGKKTVSEIKDSLYANYKFYLDTGISNWNKIRPKGVL